MTERPCIGVSIRAGRNKWTPTINDELKLWKDEQVKVSALSAALPDAVANAMLATWPVAVEHGEKAFDQRREEIESELAAAVDRAQTAETSLGEQCARTEHLSSLLRQSDERETAQRAELAAKEIDLRAELTRTTERL